MIGGGSPLAVQAAVRLYRLSTAYPAPPWWPWRGTLTNQFLSTAATSSSLTSPWLNRYQAAKDWAWVVKPSVAWRGELATRSRGSYQFGAGIAVAILMIRSRLTKASASPPMTSSRLCALFSQRLA